MIKIAALFIQRGGVYYGLPNVEPWGNEPGRDAKNYKGPHPVIAHPPCARWGRYWNGGPAAKTKRKLGDDGGCFEAAFRAVCTWGGVLEHPEGSHAWRIFHIRKPPRQGGWIEAGLFIPNAWTCCVEQGHYGHPARKARWLFAVGHKKPPELIWGRSHVSARFENSYRSPEKRRRATKTGVVQRLSKRQREATPIPFRDVLIRIVQEICYDVEKTTEKKGFRG